MILKYFEDYLDAKGWRGFLRKTRLYFPYKVVKSCLMLFDKNMIHLYSRKLFRDQLNKKENIYSKWLCTFLSDEPENFLVNLKDKDPLPWMYIEAVFHMKLILQLLDKPIVYEFGGGTSTLFFSKFSEKVYTVESSPEWGNLLQEELRNRKIENVHLSIVPKSANRSDKNYTSSVKENEGYYFDEYCSFFSQGEFDEPNLILIDGEARIHCVREILSICKPGTILVIDNYLRDHYKQMVQDLKSRSSRFFEYFGPTTYNQAQDGTIIFHL
jgi:predicted O-methyltransferase YrrM